MRLAYDSRRIAASEELRRLGWQEWSSLSGPHDPRQFVARCRPCSNIIQGLPTHRHARPIVYPRGGSPPALSLSTPNSHTVFHIVLADRVAAAARQAHPYHLRPGPRRGHSRTLPEFALGRRELSPSVPGDSCAPRAGGNFFILSLNVGAAAAAVGDRPRPQPPGACQNRANQGASA